MLLTIDIGNTTVAVGGFLGPELRFVRRLPSDRNMDAAACAARMRTLLAEEGAALQDVEGAVLSSVVPSLTQVAVQAAEALTRRPVRVLGRDLDPGLPTGDYDVSNLGMDRLVDCVAALARWRPPLAVFDMGTATTLSVVDREGIFRGGMILPGLRLSVDALSARAAQLPCITFTQPARGTAGYRYCVLHAQRRPLRGRRRPGGDLPPPGGGAGPRHRSPYRRSWP